MWPGARHCRERLVAVGVHCIPCSEPRAVSRYLTRAPGSFLGRTCRLLLRGYHQLLYRHLEEAKC